MKRYLMLAFCAVGCIAAFALKYEYRFSNAPLSAALTRISRDHPELKLSFIYDELDNYRTSAHIGTDNGVEAVRRLTSMLPVRVSHTRNGVYVEAMQRGVYRYSGRAVGEGNEGVPHAVVMILAPRDSSVLTYAFTGDDGRFSIPCDVHDVILKLSSVGYMTTWRKTTGFNVGDVRMNLLPVALKGVTVKTDYARIYPDKTVFIPGKREKNASHGGADLLLAMGLPTIRVNPADKSITTNLGDEVSTFIDYLPVDKNELAGMRPHDVKRVEVYENPQDPRFNGARYVVNFIMVQYEYGGYTKFDVSQNLPDPNGNYALNSKFNYKKMTYDISTGYYYEKDTHSRSVAQSDYRFTDSDVSWLVESDARHYRYDTEYVTFRAIYSDDRNRVSNTVGYQGSGGRFRRRQRNWFTPEIYPDGISTEGIDSRSNSATWKGVYQFFMPRAVTLSINPTFRYSHHVSGDSYSTEENVIATDARENAFSGFINADCRKQWGKQSLSVSVFGELLDNRLNYEGSNLSETNSFTGSVGARLSSSLILGNFWLSPSVSLYYSYKKFDDVKDTQLLPKYYIELGYNFNDRNKINMWSEMSHWTVGVAQRSPNTVVLNLLDAVTGNPSLRPSLFNLVGIQYQWNVRSNLFLSVLGRYNRLTKPISDVYAPTIIEGREMMLKSLEREGYYSELYYGGTASLSLFDRTFNMWASAYGIHSSRGGKNRYCGNFGILNVGLNYYLKNIYFSVNYNAPRHSISQENRILRMPSYYSVTAGWGAHGFNVSVTGSDIFRSSDKSVYVERAYENYSTWTQEYSRSVSRGVSLQLSYSFSYGKKVQQDNGLGRTGEISSGILK